ncbi:plastocyanin/azurin family copper-binding protein, partial [Haloarcula rubripromontorii]
VDMQAVAFNPEELTVSVGDKVAWKHAGGEAHNVVAYEEELPEGATYWASGGFESESAAREGWENGKGAVQSGQSYVHTFETAGEHGYFCVPHEAAGMVGTVVVEE